MNFGNIFQEFGQTRQADSDRASAKLQLLWIFATFFLTMAFVGNLKSILVKKTYEPETSSIREIIDKDMRVFIYEGVVGFLGLLEDKVTIDILSQARKTNGIYKTGYVIKTDNK